jgi:hypothetical protein
MQARPRGATWVTREHVFVDRVACPWLIRRFIDPEAAFEFVPWDARPAELERQGKVPFDMEGARFGHRRGADGRERCTFEVLVEEFGLGGDEALQRVARVVHAADVEGALDTCPEARGLKAVSWGWRFTFPDDHDAVREGAKLYDALYTWARVQMVQERDQAALQRMSSRERYDHLRRRLLGQAPAP